MHTHAHYNFIHRQHNLLIVLDECQSKPLDFLQIIFDVLQMKQLPQNCNWEIKLDNLKKKLASN